MSLFLLDLFLCIYVKHNIKSLLFLLKYICDIQNVCLTVIFFILILQISTPLSTYFVQIICRIICCIQLNGCYFNLFSLYFVKYIKVVAYEV